ncbi:GNAT family N-acetyltransferase [Neisseriaceae bacterium PsAf]|nr:GNAT family N-acetyltransferase [Neisseriaceae bacterium PsAf]
MRLLNKNMKENHFFEKTYPIGIFSLKEISTQEDILILEQWLTSERANFWNMQHYTTADFIQYYQDIKNDPDRSAYLGYLDNTLIFMVELYNPKFDEVSQHYPVQKGDIGMHFYINQPQKIIPGFSFTVISYILDFLFQNKNNQRVVVEPDKHNTKIHPLNTRAGFKYAKEIELSYKTALLAFCTREDFYKTQLNESKNDEK